MYEYFSTNTKQSTPGLAHKNPSAGTQKPKTKSRRRPKPKTKTNREIQPREKLGQQFLTLFNIDYDVFDCITAKVPEFGKPEWTKLKYPLDPPVFWKYYIDPNKLVGKRFRRTTNYGLADIDINSSLHPSRNLERFNMLLFVLKKLGIEEVIIVRSSNSGGYHIYFFFSKEIETYLLAIALRLELEKAGFTIKGGELEIFPNTKSYSKDKFTLYQAHRMPLQTGSVFLNVFGKMSNDLLEFIDQAETSKKKNDITKLRRKCKQHHKQWNQRRFKQMKQPYSTKALEFEEHLLTQIQQGFTDDAQTNDFIKTVVTDGIIFKGLDGDELLEYVINTTRNASGYQQYCGHKKDLKRRGKDWIKCGKKMYIPYKKKPTPEDIMIHRANNGNATYKNTMNSDTADKNRVRQNEYSRNKAKEATERIEVIANLLRKQKEQFPTKKAFMDRAREVGKELHGVTMSNNTLLKNQHLWHDLITTNNTTPNESNSDKDTQVLDKLIYLDCDKNTKVTSTRNQDPTQSPPTSQNDHIRSGSAKPQKKVNQKKEASIPDTESDYTIKSDMSKMSSRSRSFDGRRMGGGKSEALKTDKFTGDDKVSEPKAEQSLSARKAQRAAQKAKKEYPETLLSLELLNKLKELEIPLDSQLIKRLSESSQYTIDGALLRFKQVRRSKIKNPAAWLMQALTDGYQPHELKYSNITKTDNQTVETADPSKQSPQPQSAREAWDGKLKITPEFLSFWEKASAIPGFLKPGQDPNNPPGNNDFYEPRVYISDKIAFVNGVEGRWYLCDWTTAALEYLPKAIAQFNKEKASMQPSVKETNVKPLKPSNTGKGKNSTDFLRFWEVAQQTPGFLRPGQTLKDIKNDDYDEPKVYISEKIAAKYLPPRADSCIKNLFIVDPDLVNWRHCEWKKAQRYLEDLLDF